MDAIEELPRQSLFEDTLISLWKVITSKESIKFVVGLAIDNIVKPKIVNYIKVRAPSSRFITVRLAKHMTKVPSNREQTMPPAWEGHIVTDRIIVYHEADKAGPHVEQYIITHGKAYNIGVKRLTKEHISNIHKVKAHTINKGKLTQASKDYLINVLRNEFQKDGWLAQTTDHSPDEARSSWLTRREGVRGYGQGETRQILDDSRVDLFKTGNTIEYRDWLLNPNENSYVFGLMEKPNTRVLKLGFKLPKIPDFEDRLHLKAHIGEDSYDRFKRMIGDDGIITIKEDGASFYFESNKEGLSLFSPRVSKETGRRINYNAKIRHLLYHTSEKTHRGMGELYYVDRDANRILTATETGGLLNSNRPLPDHVDPRLMIYRIDSVGRQQVSNLSYSENLGLIGSLVLEFNDSWVGCPVVVDWGVAKEVANKHEGLIGVPKDKSLLDGRKYKPRGDLYDWTVVAINLYDGPSGGPAGVVLFDNGSGKTFQIGATSMGDRANFEELKSNPDKYIGRVAKVSSYKGHEGRSPKFEDWHLDK